MYDFVAFDEDAMFVFTFEILYTFDCSIVFTWREREEEEERGRRGRRRGKGEKKEKVF